MDAAIGGANLFGSTTGIGGVGPVVTPPTAFFPVLVFLTLIDLVLVTELTEAAVSFLFVH